MAKYNNIEAERGRLGLTKIEMAAKIEMSTPSYYNKVINGTTDLSATDVRKLQDVTGKSADYLLETEAPEVIADADTA